MVLPKKVKNALKSSPATKPLINYLENLTVEGGSGYDDTALKGRVSALETSVGDADTDNTLVKDVASLKTSKANSNHTHTLSNVTDLETVEAVFTYEDDSTETKLLVVQTNSNE